MQVRAQCLALPHIHSISSGCGLPAAGDCNRNSLLVSVSVGSHARFELSARAAHATLHDQEQPDILHHTVFQHECNSPAGACICQHISSICCLHRCTVWNPAGALVCNSGCRTKLHCHCAALMLPLLLCMQVHSKQVLAQNEFAAASSGAAFGVVSRAHSHFGLGVTPPLQQCGQAAQDGSMYRKAAVRSHVFCSCDHPRQLAARSFS
jgi:hypothetical protein